MRWIHPRNASFALKFRSLAQVGLCEAGKGESRRVVHMVRDRSFWGWVPACLLCYCVFSPLKQSDSTGSGDSILCSGCLWWHRQRKAPCFRSWSYLETSVVPSFHYCFYTPPSAPSLAQGKANRTACALRKRKHIAGYTNPVTERSELFWLIAISIAPLSIWNYSKSKCITWPFLKTKGRKTCNMVSLKDEDYK